LEFKPVAKICFISPTEAGLNSKLDWTPLAKTLTPVIHTSCAPDAQLVVWWDGLIRDPGNN
jgi:hypothetical protein